MGDASATTATADQPTAMPSTVHGVSGLGGAHYNYPEGTPDGPYRVLQQYHSKPRKLRVACVGAGASGLCLAYKMERMMEPGSWELTLFEKNKQFGGTWYENTYPGVACDIPSHLYTFSFDPNPDWSYYFAQGDEIQRYFEGFADRYGSRKYMKLNTKVVKARWDEDDSIWNLTLEDQVSKEQWSDWAHCLVNGTGILNTWQWPDIEGLHDFKGPLMHSAAWNHDVDLTNKTVGVVGTGSTSVQIVPQLQKICKQVQVYMRSPTWISPPFGAGALATDLTKGADVDPGHRQYKFTEQDKKRFREDPAYHLDFRRRIEAEINGLFGMYQQGSELSNTFRELITAEMNRRMGPGHEDLKSFIIPKWSPGCRRISPGDGYLEALVQPNVETVFDSGIDKVTSDAIVTKDGKERKIDILVCATGFKVAFKPAFKVINGAGKSIHDDWGEGVNLYLGVSAPRYLSPLSY
jgi:cation diffusion facilitator CzcD-associated flavoprotein CzcO